MLKNCARVMALVLLIGAALDVAVPQKALAANVPVSISCSSTAVRNSLNNITGWRLSFVVRTSAGVAVRVDGGGAANTFHQTGGGPTYSGSVVVNGSTHGNYSFTAQAENPDTGGDTCSGSGSGGPAVTVTPTPPPGPSSGTITANPNPCIIPTGGQACTSNISYTTSGVQFAEVYVSFNSGPEVLFTDGITCTQNCPADFITAVPDYYDFRLYNATGGQRILLAGVRVTGNTGTTTGREPAGNFDSVVCDAQGGSLRGWAYDPDQPALSISVHVYRDGPAGAGGVFVASVLANMPRPDITQTGVPGDHGFVLSPLPAALRDGLDHTVYVYAINDNGVGPNPLLPGSPKPVRCPGQPQCPNLQTVPVVLADSLIRVGQTTQAFAPLGWSGGQFASSNQSVAEVGNPQPTSADVTGKSVGGADISGVGWTAANGAAGCQLGPAVLSVVPAQSEGTVTANPNPISICTTDQFGETNITAQATVFAEVRIDNLEGLPNNSLLFTVPALQSKTVPTGKRVKNGTVARLVDPGNGGQELSRVSLSLLPKDCSTSDDRPRVDLKAVNPDGSLSDGPVSVPVGSSVPLRWTSENTKSCLARDGWTSSTATAGQGIGGPVLATRVFTIVCQGPGGEAEDSVVVNVTASPPPPGGPPVVDSWVYNTSTAAGAGLSADCNQILAVWTKPTEAVDGYRIYYFDSGKVLWTLLLQVTAAQTDDFTVLGQNRLGKQFSPPSTSTPYRYRVYTYRGATQGEPARDATGSPIAPVLCDGGSGDLSPSNKDIIKIRNRDLAYSKLVDQDHKIAPGLPIIEGDAIEFAIHLVNGGTTPITSAIQVDDVMTNLRQPPGKDGFNLKVSCEGAGQCKLRNVVYNEPSRRLSFVVEPIGNNSLAAGSKEVWSVTFTALVHAPFDRLNQPFRFQNKAYVNGVTGPLLITPYILVLPNGSPTFEEIQ